MLDGKGRHVTGSATDYDIPTHPGYLELDPGYLELDSNYSDDAFQKTGEQFSAVFDKRLGDAIKPPPAQPRTFATMWPKVLSLFFIVLMGGISAVFSIGPSKDEAAYFEQEICPANSGFYIFAACLLSFCSLITNTFQASGIMFNTVLAINSINERTAEEKFLLEQENFKSILLHNLYIVITSILAAITSLSMGELAAEDQSGRMHLAILVGIWTFNTIVANRGVMDFGKAIPFTPANHVDRLKVKLGKLDAKKASLNAAARKGKNLLADRLKTSYKAFLQLTDADWQAVFELLERTDLSSADKFHILLNLGNTRTDTENGYNFSGSRPANKPLNPYRNWLFVKPMVLFMCVAQFGYIFLGKIGIESLVKNIILSIIWLILAAIVYWGLTWESTKELTIHAADGQKTLFQITHPNAYKRSNALINLLGLFSGAPLGNANRTTTGDSPGQTVVYLPPRLRTAGRWSGYASDVPANIYFSKLFSRDLALLDAKYFAEESRIRQLIFLKILTDDFASDFEAMPIHKFIGLLNAYKVDDEGNPPEARLLDIGDLIEFFRENGMTDEEILCLFPTLTAGEYDEFFEEAEPDESSSLLASSMLSSRSSRASSLNHSTPTGDTQSVHSAHSIN